MLISLVQAVFETLMTYNTFLFLVLIDSSTSIPSVSSANKDPLGAFTVLDPPLIRLISRFLVTKDLASLCLSSFSMNGILTKQHSTPHSLPSLPSTPLFRVRKSLPALYWLNTEKPLKQNSKLDHRMSYGTRGDEDLIDRSVGRGEWRWKLLLKIATVVGGSALIFFASSWVMVLLSSEQIISQALTISYFIVIGIAASIGSWFAWRYYVRIKETEAECGSEQLSSLLQ